MNQSFASHTLVESPSIMYKIGLRNLDCNANYSLSGMSESTIELSSSGRQHKRWFNPDKSLDTFSEYYAYVSSNARNVTVAVYQGRSDIHSEVIAPFVELLRAAGFRKLIVYNSAISKNSLSFIRDPHHIFGYDEVADGSIVPLFKGWRSWDLRPHELLFEQQSEWDFLVMLTGDEIYKVYDNTLYRSFMSNITALHGRVLAVQHHREWHNPAVYSNDLLLTPSMGKHKWIFPFFTVSKSDSFEHLAHLSVDIKSHISSGLLILGAIGGMISHTARMKYKDKADIVRYLEHDATNKVVNVARWGDFDEISANFPTQALGLKNLIYYDLYSVLRLSKIVWIPIPKDSLYMSGSFASSIAYSFAFEKLMVMPSHLAEYYELHGAVIEYTNTVLEVNFTDINEEKLRNSMRLWEMSKRAQNIMNLYKECLF